jgi:hypothetical protein
MCRRPTERAAAPVTRGRLGRLAALVRLATLATFATLASAAVPMAASVAAPASSPAPLAAGSIAVADDGEARAMLERLRGQRARRVADRLVIDDVAGEGRPWVGTIERRGDELWLITDGGAVRLAGPLARPRVAGPGYRAWVTGALVDGAPPTLRVRRLGILARPSATAAARPAR